MTLNGTMFGKENAVVLTMSQYLFHTLIMEGTCQPGMCHLTLTPFSSSSDFGQFLNYHATYRLTTFGHVSPNHQLKSNQINQPNILLSISVKSQVLSGGRIAIPKIMSSSKLKTRGS